jgi:peroxiredoxin
VKGSVRLMMGLLAVALARPAGAQLRAGLVDDPKPGEDAPDFALSYLTADGPGPSDQPFRLRAELGRWVVLVFAAGRDRAAIRKEWEALAAGRDSLFGTGVSVVGLVRWKAEPTQTLAHGLTGSIKFLPDSVGRGYRTFGVSHNRDRWAAYVVDPEGRVAYRSRTFLPSDAQELSALAAALRPGRS